MMTRMTLCKLWTFHRWSRWKHLSTDKLTHCDVQCDSPHSLCIACAIPAWCAWQDGQRTSLFTLCLSISYGEKMCCCSASSDGSSAEWSTETLFASRLNRTLVSLINLLVVCCCVVPTHNAHSLWTIIYINWLVWARIAFRFRANWNNSSALFNYHSLCTSLSSSNEGQCHWIELTLSLSEKPLKALINYHMN